MDNNIIKFPEKKSDINLLFDGMLGDGVEEAFIIGIDKDGLPILGQAGFDDPLYLLYLLENARETIKILLREGYYDEEQ